MSDSPRVPKQFTDAHHELGRLQGLITGIAFGRDDRDEIEMLAERLVRVVQQDLKERDLLIFKLLAEDDGWLTTAEAEELVANGLEKGEYKSLNPCPLRDLLVRELRERAESKQ